MKRTAFTLMELLVSVVLITLISMYMYGALGQTRASNAALVSHTEDEAARQKVFSLFYRDLISSYSINVLPTKDKHYQVIELQTGNSLYNIAAPHVTYFVRADTLTLVRLEAARTITLPVPYEERDLIHVDVIDGNVTDFNFYTSGQSTLPKEVEERSRQQVDEAFERMIGHDVTSKPVAHELKTHLLYLNTKSRRTPLLVELAF